MTVREIPLEATYPLRMKILRPGGDLAERYFDQDRLADVFHLGVFAGNTCISIGSFYPEGHAELPANTPFRLRGMATDTAYQGSGAGTLLLRHALQRLEQSGADLLWCNARIKAVPFYERLGLHSKGELFEVPRIGPHYLMFLRFGRGGN